MKMLTDREKIAEAINIERMPVITINIGECMKGYDDCYEGSKVLVEDSRRKFPVRCTVKMFGDKAGNKDYHAHPWMYKDISLVSYGACLSDSFGYSDVMEMLDYANKPILHAGEEVVVIFDDNKNRTCYIRLMRVGDHIDRLCSTVAKLVDA